MELSRKVGLRSSRRVPFYNGPIDCRLLVYDLFEGALEDLENPVVENPAEENPADEVKKTSAKEIVAAPNERAAEVVVEEEAEPAEAPAAAVAKKPVAVYIAPELLDTEETLADELEETREKGVE